MERRILLAIATISATLLACERRLEGGDAAIASPRGNVDSGFAAVADSVWVDVKGPTLIGFHPIRTNEQLERDADLATVLDDFAYHIGTAMDSLIAAGFTVHYRGGDTVFMRSGGNRWRFVRQADSADVGYIFTDAVGRQAIAYGVRTYVDLIEYVHEFKRAGQLRSR